MSTSSRLALHWQVLIGLALGVAYAWASIRFGWNDFTLDYIQPLGDIFINILKLIAVPLVLFSIIGGVASLGDVKKARSPGGQNPGALPVDHLLRRHAWLGAGEPVPTWRRRERIVENLQPNPL